MNAGGVATGAGSALSVPVGPVGDTAAFAALSHAGNTGAADAAAGRFAAAWLVAAGVGAGVPAAAAGPSEPTAAGGALRLDAPPRVAGAERAVPLRGVAPF